MHFKAAVLLISLWSVAQSSLVRVKRQDWNFPGPVDNSDIQTNRLTTPRPPTRATTVPTTQRRNGAATLPPVGIIVFDAPCNRCMTTRQYNPVCASDGRTYANQGILDCARTCGFDATFTRLGVCETPR